MLPLKEARVERVSCCEASGLCRQSGFQHQMRGSLCVGDRCYGEVCKSLAIDLGTTSRCTDKCHFP